MARIPPTRFPNAATVSYYRSIKDLIDEAYKLVQLIFRDDIIPLIHGYRVLINDSEEEDDPLDLIERIIEYIRQRVTQTIFTDKVVNALARRFLGNVDNFSKKNIQDQAKVIRAIDPTQGEDWLASFMRTAVRENVSYINSIADEFLNKVETIVFNGVRGGRSINEMAKDIKNIGGVSTRRAKFIARDQAGTIYGQMTEIRHKRMGVYKFKWSSSGDEKVRTEHKNYDGKVYTYKEGAGPEGKKPGQDFYCRCVAIPVFEE